MAKVAKIWDGTAWVDLATSVPDLSNYQLKSETGLQLVKKQTIGTAVSSVTVTDAFSATYDNYLIKVSGGAHSTGGSALLTIQIGASTTGYYNTLIYSGYSGTTVSGVNVNNGSVFNYVGAAQANGLNANISVSSPFLAKPTLVEGAFYDTSNSGRSTGYLNDTTSYTSFIIGCPTGTITGGTIYVYGYGIS